MWSLKQAAAWAYFTVDDRVFCMCGFVPLWRVMCWAADNAPDSVWDDRGYRGRPRRNL